MGYIKNIGLVALGIAICAVSDNYFIAPLSQEEKKPEVAVDFNKDGFEDFMGIGKSGYYALISKDSTNYVKGNVVSQDGVGFVKVDSGFYDSYGKFFPLK